MAWNFVDWKIFNKWQRKAWQDTTIVTSMRTINKRLFLSKFNSLSESRIFIIKSWTDQRFRKRLRFLTSHFSSPASVAFLFYPSIFFLKFPRVFPLSPPFLLPVIAYSSHIFLNFPSLLADHCQPPFPRHTYVAYTCSSTVQSGRVSWRPLLYPPTLVSRGSIRGRKSRVDINSFIAAASCKRVPRAVSSLLFPLATREGSI